jgi:cytoskeletal protein CcmA (bactofilin family)
MWKRDNESAPTPQPAAAPTPVRREDPEPVAPRPAATPGTRALLGPSIEFHGDIVGGEDLLIEGRLQGKVRLPQHAVAIGPKGRVNAEIQGRVIEVEGEVEGQLHAEELIVLRKSARVRGDLVAPRVVLEDGAKFKGTVDMEPKASAAAPRARSEQEMRSDKSAERSASAANPANAGPSPSPNASAPAPATGAAAAASRAS